MHEPTERSSHDHHDHEHDHDHGREHDHDHREPDYDHGHDHAPSLGDHDHDHDHDHGHHDHDHDHDHGVLAKLKHLVVPHSHDHSEVIESSYESSEVGIRTAWIGLAGMMATAVAQLVIVALSGSIALLADTIHNLGHAATTIPLIVAFRMGLWRATKRYPYGYRRAEDLVGLFIGLIILVSAAVIIWESVDALINPRVVTNLWWVFAAGIVGFLGNELVAIYRIRGGRRIGSAALIAEGQHARADGLTSIAVAIGMVGVWLGYPQADPIVGFLISIMILGILVASMRTVVRRLMDGVDEGLIDRLTAIVKETPGVVAVDTVRARWSGHRMSGDVAIQIDSAQTVLQGHRIAEEVEHAALHAVPNMDSVVVHLHPVVPADEASSLHELSGHHASREARDAYRARQAAQSLAPVGD